MEPSSRSPLPRGRALRTDVLLALGIGLVQVVGVLLSERYGHSPDWRDPDALAYLLLTAGAAALLLRRRWPLGVLAVTLACGLAYAARTYPEGPSQLAVYPALWTVALTVPRRRAWLAAAVAALAVGAAELFFYDDTMLDGEPLYAAVTVLAAMWWGEAVRARRAYVAELRDRAERAERTREEEARRRVDEERMRIARELHDVVSHTIGVISVQAGVASHLLHRRPDKAADSLAAIRQASDEALGELHAMLGVLREGEGDSGRAPLAPAPGLAELDALVAQAAGAGVEVTVSLEG
ncbi:MAG: histidine kinase dimerization/phosphoacceptor domain-containing protein, partial [Actinomycetota bacterium]|nr:histidine kinase dimerization/phosphoacceptor domain-containing protein [Actinomycetota bacterium]